MLRIDRTEKWLSQIAQKNSSHRSHRSHRRKTLNSVPVSVLSVRDSLRFYSLLRRINTAFELCGELIAQKNSSHRTHRSHKRNTQNSVLVSVLSVRSVRDSLRSTLFCDALILHLNYVEN